jgi:glucokinase
VLVDNGDLTIGFDVGGTSVRAALVAPQRGTVGPVIDDVREGDVLEQLAATYTRLTDAAALRPVQVLAAGVAIPGSLDRRTGLIASAPTSLELVGLDPGTIRLGTVGTVRFVNDANAALHAEQEHGAARGARDVVGIFVGTGVGGGAVVGGRLLIGSVGVAGEIGHMVIAPDGPCCPCGGQGCLEQLASGTAIARRYRQRTGRDVDGARDVALAARAGDSCAIEAFHRAARYLGVAVATLANLMNPEVVVVGGGVAAAWDLFGEDLTRTAMHHTMPLAARGLRIVPAALGRLSGVIGAALLASSPSG